MFMNTKQRVSFKQTGVSSSSFISEAYWKKQKEQRERWAREDAAKLKKQAGVAE